MPIIGKPERSEATGRYQPRDDLFDTPGPLHCFAIVYIEYHADPGGGSIPPTTMQFCGLIQSRNEASCHPTAYLSRCMPS